MNLQPCKCCDHEKTPPKSRIPGKWYNRVVGKIVKWTRKNDFRKSERTVKAVGGRRFNGQKELADKCGNGVWGFPTRRAGDGVKITVGLDGQWKVKRTTIVRAKSARSIFSRHPKQIWGIRYGLWSNSRVLECERDPSVVAAQEKMNRKMKRRDNRNYGARKGMRKSHEAT